MTQKRRKADSGKAIGEMTALRWEPTHVTKPNPRVVPLHPTFDLQSLLSVLTRQVNSPQKKRYCGIKKPDPFSGGGPDELRAFIFQCQIYFCACEGEFLENIKRIFFAISYFQGVALDYFKSFINEPDPY